jgi:hypothetical protein
MLGVGLVLNGSRPSNVMHSDMMARRPAQSRLAIPLISGGTSATASMTAEYGRLRAATRPYD